jgi:hypothetical protein
VQRFAGESLEGTSIAAEDASERFSFLRAFVSLDNPTSSELTRQWLDWQPIHPGLIEDLDHGHYFDSN